MIPSTPVNIIAEAGVNHNGDTGMALRLVEEAAKAGADTVKFQTLRADRLLTRQAPKAVYQMHTTDAGESQFEMIRRLELSEEAHQLIAARCRELGIEFLSTPFDVESLNFLVKDLYVGRIKIPSGEITNAPLLLAAARTGKPVFLSTGMSSLGEVETALSVLAFGYLKHEAPPSREGFSQVYRDAASRRVLLDKVTLLHCTTDYPAPPAAVNLAALSTLRSAFGLPVGYSDHTEGIAVATAAAALGATVIEKHFTLDRGLPGPDHKASLEPGELRDLVRSVRTVTAAIGNPVKASQAGESANIPVARKSLVTLKPIRQGEPFTPDNLGAKRPGTGISPLYYWDILGTTARRDYAVDELLEGRFGFFNDPKGN